jgi:hypothetical protein
VRLLNEAEQILLEQDLDLERNREQLKAIRRGEWSPEQIEQYFENKERHLESIYNNSDLRQSPDLESLKELLLNCLEHHYGSLEKCVVQEDKAIKALKDIDLVMERVRGLLN